MIFAAIVILFTVIVALSVALPLLRRNTGDDEPVPEPDPVYREQLRELDRERADGLIDEAAYASSRAEIGRRLIAAELKSGGGAAPSRGNAKRYSLIATGVVVVVFIGAGLAYPFLGVPGAKDQPLAARMNAEQPELAVLIAQVERHLAQNPEDGRGWDVLAPIYLRENRLDLAFDAYSNAIRFAGPSSARLVGLGEVIVAQRGGIVDEQAVEIFQQAEALSPGSIRAAYYIALAAEQTGRHELALNRFTALLEGMNENATGRESVRRHIAFNCDQLAQPVAAMPGPSQADIDAAADLTPQQRSDMVEGMLAGLAEKLKQDPDDIDGWLRLIRSYAVVGRNDDAVAALADALEYFGAESAAGRRLEALATELNLAGG